MTPLKPVNKKIAVQALNREPMRPFQAGKLAMVSVLENDPAAGGVAGKTFRRGRKA
jgi:hypothetical protein